MLVTVSTSFLDDIPLGVGIIPSCSSKGTETIPYFQGKLPLGVWALQLGYVGLLSLLTLLFHLTSFSLTEAVTR